MNIKFTKGEKICMKFFEILGVQNFDVTKINGENFQDRGTLCRFCIMLIRLSVILTTIFFATISMYDVEATDGKANQLMGLLILSVQLAMVTMMFVINFGFFLSTRKLKLFYINLFEVINSVRDELSFLNCDAILSVKKKPNCVLIFAIFFTILSILHFKSVLTHSYKGKEYVLIATYFAPNLFYMAAIFQYIFLINLTNQNLVCLVEIVNEIRIGFYVAKGNNDLLPTRMIEDKILRALKTCRRIYNLIYENSQLINEFHGIFLILMIFIFVASGTSYGYIIYVKIINNSDTLILLGDKF